MKRPKLLFEVYFFVSGYELSHSLEHVLILILVSGAERVRSFEQALIH